MDRVGEEALSQPHRSLVRSGFLRRRQTDLRSLNARPIDDDAPTTNFTGISLRGKKRGKDSAGNSGGEVLGQSREILPQFEDISLIEQAATSSPMPDQGEM